MHEASPRVLVLAPEHLNGDFLLHLPKLSHFDNVNGLHVIEKHNHTAQVNSRARSALS